MFLHNEFMISRSYEVRCSAVVIFDTLVTLQVASAVFILLENIIKVFTTSSRLLISFRMILKLYGMIC